VQRAILASCPGSMRSPLNYSQRSMRIFPEQTGMNRMMNMTVKDGGVNKGDTLTTTGNGRIQYVIEVRDKHRLEELTSGLQYSGAALKPLGVICRSVSLCPSVLYCPAQPTGFPAAKLVVLYICVRSSYLRV